MGELRRKMYIISTEEHTIYSYLRTYIHFSLQKIILKTLQILIYQELYTE